MNYYFDSATIKNTEVKRRFKRAFDLWQRKSQIFSFNEVFNEKQADIYISLSEEADIATINPDIIIPAGKVNNLKKQSIYHTKIIFPIKYFAFNFNKDFRNYKITQNLIIYSLGMTLGLKPHESEPDSTSCLYSWSLGNHEKRDCESLTSSINTLNIIYK